MLLADTSIWIDHFRSSDATLARALEAGEIVTHAFVMGELALGSLRARDEITSALRNLPRAAMATEDEVLTMISVHRLFGTGIGYIDAHLIASVLLTTGTSLWTRDKRLRAQAERMAIAAALR